MEGAGAHMAANLSPWGMFMAADIVVQGVMAGLVLASVLVWTVFLAKSVEIALAARRLKQAAAAIRKSPAVTTLTETLPAPIAEAFVREAQAELDLSQGAPGAKDRAQTALDRLTATETRRIGAGLGLVATIGSTAPFVGLFGTVWGIMNSFIGIAETRTTNLAVVAPGIAEALLATALGLVVAIPAVIIYNHFSRVIAGYRALVADTASIVARNLSRELELRVR